MSAIELHIPIRRDVLLTANQRLHWRRKAERTKSIRTIAHVLALAEGGSKPFPGRVHLTVSIAWPDARRRDAGNLHPTLKACVDGIADAGWLEDDSDRYLVGPDLRVSDERCSKDYACKLTFTFEPVLVDMYARSADA